MRKPKATKILLSELEPLVAEVDAPELHPADLPAPLIIDREYGLEIVDGFHRASGMVSWALANGRPLSRTWVQAIDVTRYDADVIAAAADPGGFGELSQEEAIEQIERAALE